MTTTRSIAAKLAAHLATDDWTPEGCAVPRIYMDALTTDIEIGEHPIVIVVPRNATGIYRGNPEYHVEAVLALDSSALHSNPAASAETPDGVIVFGSGALLDELVDALVNSIEKALAGAILADVQVEYSMDALPIQYATLQLTYKRAVAYGDFCPT